MAEAKKLTDRRAAELFHVSARNLLQTYKNPRPTKQKKEYTDEELHEKMEQYEIIRLGATCKEYRVDEATLLKIVAFIESVAK